MPLFFHPSRDSRHRTACFALYKALLRHGSQVPLPADVSSGVQTINPIRELVRRGFRRNKNDTSPRLVVSALMNGYKFLDLLTKAKAQTSSEHSSIVAFLRENESRLRAHADAIAALPSPPSTAPRPGTIPLLTRLASSTPGEPVYVPTVRPRPLSEMKGDARKVPVLAALHDIPFLRMAKPQPPMLSRVLRQKYMRRQKRIQRYLEMVEDDMTDARLEDDWDVAMEQLQTRERTNSRGRRRAATGDKDASFQDAVQGAMVELNTSLNHERIDLVARGKALWKLVEEEQAMADNEREERRRRKREAKKSQTSDEGNN